MRTIESILQYLKRFNLKFAFNLYTLRNEDFFLSFADKRLRTLKVKSRTNKRFRTLKVKSRTNENLGH